MPRLCSLISELLKQRWGKDNTTTTNVRSVDGKPAISSRSHTPRLSFAAVKSQLHCNDTLRPFTQYHAALQYVQLSRISSSRSLERGTLLFINISNNNFLPFLHLTSTVAVLVTEWNDERTLTTDHRIPEPPSAQKPLIANLASIEFNMAASASQYQTMTTNVPPAMATLATMVRRADVEVLVIDSKPPPSPTSFNPSVLTQASWTTQITSLPTEIPPPSSSTSTSDTSDNNDPGHINHGTSISLILLLSLSAAVIIWIVSYVLISRRRRARADGSRVSRRWWPSFSFSSAFVRKKGSSSYRRVKRSDSVNSLIATDGLASGAKLDHREIPSASGYGSAPQQQQLQQQHPAVATWTHPPPVELDGQGIGDPPIQRPDWVSRVSTFLATGVRPKGQEHGHGHRRMESSVRATRSIRESFGEKINDPGVAVLIQEPKKTLSRYSTYSRYSVKGVAISEKALPEIPEDSSSSTEESSVPVPVLIGNGFGLGGLAGGGGPQIYGGTRYWERTGRAGSPNTVGSEWTDVSVKSSPLSVLPGNTIPRRVEEEEEIIVGFTEVRTLRR